MKLLILLGAGSSCGQSVSAEKIGMNFPLVEELNAEVLKWAAHHAIVTSTTDFFGRLWQLRAEYNQSDPVVTSDQRVNFEQVLGDC